MALARPETRSPGLPSWVGTARVVQGRKGVQVGIRRLHTVPSRDFASFCDFQFGYGYLIRTSTSDIASKMDSLRYRLPSRYPYPRLMLNDYARLSASLPYRYWISVWQGNTAACTAVNREGHFYHFSQPTFLSERRLIPRCIARLKFHLALRSSSGRVTYIPYTLDLRAADRCHEKNTASSQPYGADTHLGET